MENDLQKVRLLANPLIESISDNSKIEAVLCYGSYAEGMQDDKSDIDLFVPVLSDQSLDN